MAYAGYMIVSLVGLMAMGSLSSLLPDRVTQATSEQNGSLLILEPRLKKSKFWAAYTSDGFGQTRLLKKRYIAAEMKHCKLSLGEPQ